MQFNIAAEDEREDTLRRFCVDREDELRFCVDAIENGANLLLYGDKGSGKTFLARLIECELRSSQTIFPVMVNLGHIPTERDREVAAAFPRAVLLQTCVAIWKRLLGLPFLKLATSLLQPTSLFESKEPSVFLHEVYSYLMADTSGTAADRTKTAGASAIAKAELSERLAQTRQRGELLPFEFLEFAEVIQNDVLEPLGKQRLVAICDETNLLPLVQQQDIIERYLQLFLSKRVQFIFVAAHFPWESVPNVSIAFDAALHLDGWPRIECLQDFLARVDSDITYPPETVGLVWEAFSGHPRRSLIAFRTAYDLARKRGALAVDAEIIRQSIDSVVRMYEGLHRGLQTFRPPQ